ncbi:MAG TPA: hypothetical protein VK485_10980 [Sphingomicrobium sp.]|nr:hypothetical protein [Sphingomicrobium sp.]
MSVLIPLVFLGLFLAPFFLSGLRRKWRIAAVFGGIFVGYALLTWSSPLPSEEAQMTELWRMIVTVIAIGSIAAFVAGLAISFAVAARQPADPKEGQ